MEEITFHHDAPDTKPRKKFLNEKLRLLFVYIPAFIVVCLVAGLLFDEHKGFSRVVDVVLTLGLNVCAFAWCRIDSTERSYKLHRYFPYAIVIFGTLALLYYLFRSRGIRGGLVSAGWLVLYVVLSFGASMIIAFIFLMLFVLVGVLPIEIFDN